MENVKGMRSLQRRLDAVARVVRDEVLLEDWQTLAVQKAKNKHHPHKKTGGTEASIQYGSRTRTEATIEAAGAAVFLEYGTKAHVIRPRFAKILAWASAIQGPTLSGGLINPTTKTGRPTKRSQRKLGSGAWAFAREVHHPGTKADPFMVPAGEEARDEVFGADAFTKPWNKAG